MKKARWISLARCSWRSAAPFSVIESASDGLTRQVRELVSTTWIRYSWKNLSSVPPGPKKVPKSCSATSAGALGLMQVMPGTAKLMAGELGIAYEPGKLTGDWAYNARLGAGYLARLIAEFGDVPVLVAAGYNAGPGRPRRWIEELGDPRAGDDATLVDWIEHIPFTETRNYVMRVGESLPVYRARLAGKTEPIRLSEELGMRYAFVTRSRQSVKSPASTTITAPIATFVRSVSPNTVIPIAAAQTSWR